MEENCCNRCKKTIARHALAISVRTYSNAFFVVTKSLLWRKFTALDLDEIESIKVRTAFSAKLSQGRRLRNQGGGRKGLSCYLKREGLEVPPSNAGKRVGPNAWKIQSWRNGKALKTAYLMKWKRYDADAEENTERKSIEKKIAFFIGWEGQTFVFGKR